MKNKEIVIDGTTYVPKGSEKLTKAPSLKGKEYCVVRTYSAGVFAGFFNRKTKGKEGKLLTTLGVSIVLFGAGGMYYCSSAK